VGKKKDYFTSSKVQKVINKPEQLIKKIRGIDYRFFEKQDMYCGSAGTYNVVHYNEAMEVLELKDESY